MTQLENNTTALQAILATVNALPNAGSGGGEISGYQVAVGEFTAVAATNTLAEAGTVTGLPFAPKIVIVYRSATITVSNTTDRVFIYGVNYEDDSSTGSFMYRTSSSAYASNYTGATYFAIIKNADGFTLKRSSYSNSTSTAYKILSGKYKYIAVG